MPRLVAPFPDFVRRGQDAIHRARRAQIGLLLEQGRIDFRGRLIDEALAVQGVQDRLSFRGNQGPGRWCPQRSPHRRLRALAAPVEGRPGEADALTERRRLARDGNRLDGVHQSVSSMSRGFRGIPRISATFFGG